MPLPQPFGATNAPHTCKWCGRKLKVYSLDRPQRQPSIAIYTETAQAQERKRELERQERVAKHGQRRGGYGDGHFCGLNCGFQFGLTFADLGKRLGPIRKEPAA